MRITEKNNNLKKMRKRNLWKRKRKKKRKKDLKKMNLWKRKRKKKRKKDLKKKKMKIVLIIMEKKMIMITGLWRKGVIMGIELAQIENTCFVMVFMRIQKRD